MSPLLVVHLEEEVEEDPSAMIDHHVLILPLGEQLLQLVHL
jgi:hypothetical protein